MSYFYLEDVATADIAFEAQSEDLNGLFLSSADATMNVMIEDLESIKPSITCPLRIENPELDMLLFDLLQEIIYYKDAQQLMLRPRSVDVQARQGTFFLTAEMEGERLDPERHRQRADVKAVTLHRFTVEKVEGGWRSLVILDV
jgi:SHS2 domain-containing protein